MPPHIPGVLPRWLQQHRDKVMGVGSANNALASALTKCTALYIPTATSGAVSSLTDVRSPNPATQASAGQRPSGAAASNGQPELLFDGTDDFLNVPFHSGNNATTRWAIAMWVRPSNVTGLRTLVGAEAIGGASTSRMWLATNGTSLLWDVYHSAFVTRRATVASAVALNTRVFITAEFDGSQSGDARAILTLNAATTSPVYSDQAGLPGTMPAALPQPTGTWALGEERNTSALRPWAGNITVVAIAQPDSSPTSGGIWTPAERVQLMNYLRPV